MYKDLTPAMKAEIERVIDNFLKKYNLVDDKGATRIVQLLFNCDIIHFFLSEADPRLIMDYMGERLQSANN